MNSLIDLINQLEAAKNAGRPDAELAQARDYQRKAQFCLDSSKPKTPWASTPLPKPSAS